MDEGKPTKGNWWSRPRPETPGTAHQPPQAPAPPPGPPQQPSDEPPADPAQPSSGHAPAAGLAQPPSGQVSAGQPQPPAPSSQPPADQAQPSSGQAAVPPSGQAPGGAPAGERPRPLHDPDPYSTPPYGEPGPWAPAPPVQHPMATPGHGTPLPAAVTHGGTPPHGTPQHGAPQPHATPGHGTPLPAAAAPHSAPQPHATPGHGTPLPAAVTHAGPAPYQSAPQGPPRQPYDPWNAPFQQTGAPTPEGEAKKRKRVRRTLLVGVMVVTLVSGGIGGAIGAYLERNGGVGDIELSQAGTEAKDRPKGSVAGIASAALPGVVTLHVRGDSAQGTGTGFVLDGKGHILTNNHVVEPAGTGGEISVTFSGGETAEAKVIGRDSGYDLAVVKVSGVRGLKPLTLGNSENVQVGDPVVAIGAPFDLANTVTSGIISAKERPITAGGEKGDGSDTSYVDALQTDAPINPGNSGGPLVDSKARVIGINSAIRSAGDRSEQGGGQAGSIGLGFAIPINQGKRVAEELINFGKATHPVIGVTLDTEFTGDGARIADKGRDGGPSVSEDGPGEKAGLKPGDVITEVDGQAVHSSDELIVKVRAHRPKDRLDLTVERDGRDREVTLVLGAASGD
ncbi:PDZ domain-containing protein [Streptomyces alfalfae]|uniref:Protease n=1 Tax=Streptomyces alfalfae TaxID=1642299 RepID=A0ABN4VI85_9ACTN|nr:trypsin-like peptidase domain-containing protein [Streptomyces alfalfae]APY86507.1 protease [Streptomyces alfalfae]AYA16893.1 PDZ domain-containing protein [Streptomyces fradiae]RXX41448.1 PDZ domain-containing protein [Streptomyces alfalfae]RZM87854.1 PDZ domain-containing protein [Streptomyces alfalfae]